MSNLDQAIDYWKERLTNNKPIYRVRVRRILEMDGAERRGIAIMRRISAKFENSGLKTVPDFQSAWIDALVNIKLANEGENSEGQPDVESRPAENCRKTESDEVPPDQVELDLSSGEKESIDKAVAPVAEALNNSGISFGGIEGFRYWCHSFVDGLFFSAR